MTRFVWLTFGTALGIASPWIYWRYRQAARLKRRAKPVAEPENSLEGVEIDAGLISCGAASALRGKRFLSEEVPSIPLPGCNQRACQCRYRYHDDRRIDDDRRNPFDRFAGFNEISAPDERRSDRKRRQSEKRAQTRAYYNDFSGV
jgi:hypothetical protein